MKYTSLMLLWVFLLSPSHSTNHTSDYITVLDGKEKKESVIKDDWLYAHWYEGDSCKFKSAQKYGNRKIIGIKSKK